MVLLFFLLSGLHVTIKVRIIMMASSCCGQREEESISSTISYSKKFSADHIVLELSISMLTFNKKGTGVYGKKN